MRHLQGTFISTTHLSKCLFMWCFACMHSKYRRWRWRRWKFLKITFQDVNKADNIIWKCLENGGQKDDFYKFIQEHDFKLNSCISLGKSNFVSINHSIFEKRIDVPVNNSRQTDNMRNDWDVFNGTTSSFIQYSEQWWLWILFFLTCQIYITNLILFSSVTSPKQDRWIYFEGVYRKVFFYDFFVPFQMSTSPEENENKVIFISLNWLGNSFELILVKWVNHITCQMLQDKCFCARN